MTKRFYCKKDQEHGIQGCGGSMSLHHPDILKQLPPDLADEFPAFLTHRSGIDKGLLALIRAGVAHRVSSNAWEDILRELHLREHDILELRYLHSIQDQQKYNEKWNIAQTKYIPFSAFDDRTQYAGHAPSKRYINNVYMDFMESIRSCLDQCMSALTGHILQWDHSFKVPKYMMKLNGITAFVGLFTVLNELGQIRYQAFVPTKSLVHIQSGLMELVKSLKEHGYPQPILGFTDNVAADMRTFIECIPSLGENVVAVNPTDSLNLPLMELPSDVASVHCKTATEIENASHGILELLDLESSNSVVHLGFDMEWEYSTGIGGTGSKKTALIQLALPKSVYLLRVYLLDKLPTPLLTILRSDRFIKVGRNIGGDFAKLRRDFSDFLLPEKSGNHYNGTIELGSYAKCKQVVSEANSSLSTLVAATLRTKLSKEMRASEWGSGVLTQSQIHYAALDAWVALEIFTTLKPLPEIGIPLTSATQIGQLVSLYSRQQEVARGKVVEQPQEITILQMGVSELKEVKMKVKASKTRALVEIFEVLAPACMIPHHRRTLMDVQNGQDKFLAVVSISSLRTYAPVNFPASNPTDVDIPRTLGPCILIKPPEIQTNVQSVMEQKELECSEVDHFEIEDDPNDMIDSDDECEDEQVVEIQEPSLVDEVQVFTQGKGMEYDSRILADVFHEIHKVTKTISRRHSLHKRFATAYSDTLLIPDEADKNAVEAVLKKMDISWNVMRAKSPDWLWKRVRRYIPPKEVLFPILKEFFGCWGNIKCSVRKIPLFTEETWKKAQAVLQDVQKGWLSDPDSIPLGTNSVEGAIHNPMRRSFAALKASPELADALTADFRHRHNVKAGSRNNLEPSPFAAGSQTGTMQSQVHMNFSDYNMHGMVNSTVPSTSLPSFGSQSQSGTSSLTGNSGKGMRKCKGEIIPQL
ncbi:hypothetical protein K435DRAFT_874751 [Dendrothele bispora CBS 962.96]|uniref:3'-5' exonuclease domain-containing protein n=1 Tax=Dendrothele bispora (strain CBS 962.96) TaxID=1314807 RepID=A0A4S8KW60_DENBC|nr:hypothetical protein K435DRAFT_874751 [Dendrothele bispora CBS 962.96]